jgi:hypothetical protein
MSISIEGKRKAPKSQSHGGDFQSGRGLRGLDQVKITGLLHYLVMANIIVFSKRLFYPQKYLFCTRY